MGPNRETSDTDLSLPSDAPICSLPVKLGWRGAGRALGRPCSVKPVSCAAMAGQADPTRAPERGQGLSPKIIFRLWPDYDAAAPWRSAQSAGRLGGRPETPDSADGCADARHRRRGPRSHSGCPRGTGREDDQIREAWRTHCGTPDRPFNAMWTVTVPRHLAVSCELMWTAVDRPGRKPLRPSAYAPASHRFSFEVLGSRPAASSWTQS